MLLIIASADVGSSLADYRKFAADERLARSSLERTKDLYAHGALPLKELQATQNMEEKARVDVATAGQRVRLLGGSVNNAAPILTVRSPVSGTVVEQNTSSGEGIKTIDNTPSLFTISGPSRVWIWCEVYENP